MPTLSPERAIRRGCLDGVSGADVARILANPEGGRQLLDEIDKKTGEAAQAREAAEAAQQLLNEEIDR